MFGLRLLLFAVVVGWFEVVVRGALRAAWLALQPTCISLRVHGLARQVCLRTYLRKLE